MALSSSRCVRNGLLGGRLRHLVASCLLLQAAPVAALTPSGVFAIVRASESELVLGPRKLEGLTEPTDTFLKEAASDTPGSGGDNSLPVRGVASEPDVWTHVEPTAAPLEKVRLSSVVNISSTANNESHAYIGAVTAKTLQHVGLPVALGAPPWAKDASTGAQISAEPAAGRFRTFDSGFCSASHAWTPGSHGCAYVQTPQSCFEAGQHLGILPGGGGRDSTGAIGSVTSSRNPPSLAIPAELGCLLGSDGALRFSEGPGRGVCSKDAQCICDCREALDAGDGALMQAPQPDPLDMLALFSTMLVLAVGSYTSAHQPCALKIVTSAGYLPLM